jgi:3-deoxy-manno-octulosonate cytidylyltransferase (CMP-KDO synthetase)
MNVCTIIPCRFNSTRFPGKPLEILNEKPLMYYPYTEAKKNKNVDKVYIATEDKRIADTCEKLNLDYIMTSPDHLTGSDRVAEAYSKIKMLKEYDIIVNVQGDEPFVTQKHIDECIKCLKENPGSQASNGICKISNQNDLLSHSSVKATISNNYKLLFLTRSSVPYPNVRTINTNFYKQLGLYGFRPEALEIFNENMPSNLEKSESIEMLRLLENDKIISTFMVDINGPSVDTFNDLLSAREIFKNKPE